MDAVRTVREASGPVAVGASAQPGALAAGARPTAGAWRVAAALAFAALAAVLVRFAWIGDDALITLRTVENWVGGRGLVWNAAERVQTFTHPAWLGLLTLVRLATGEPFFGTLGLSFALTLAAAAVVARLARGAAAATAVLVALVFARAFADYAVSGLENPLVYALLAWLAVEAFRERAHVARARRVALVVALLGLARLDLVVIGLPLLVASARGAPRGRWLRAVALGLAPLALWHAFAAFYYGSPFPITAHAKAFDTGVPAGELARQGLWFLAYVARFDAVTAAVIVAGVAVGFARREAAGVALALGALLYLAYAVKVGGDFMGGRFATPPFVVALALVGRALGRARPAWSLAACAIAVLLGSVPRAPGWWQPPSADRQGEVFHGISDERVHYYPRSGLLAPERAWPSAGALSTVLEQLRRTRPIYEPGGVAGRVGFEAGPLVHVVDPWLLDPLLMRLPLGTPDGRWRIGHVERAIPVGYWETLAFGEDRFQHAGLARYHANLREAIGGPLLARERLAALWRLWTGAYDADLAAYEAEHYLAPPRPIARAADLAIALPPSELGTWPHWFDHAQSRVVYPVGLEVRLERPTDVARLDLQLSGGDWLLWRITLLSGGDAVHAATIDARPSHRHLGMADHTVEVPAGTPRADAILLEAPDCPTVQIAALGSLRVTPR